MNDDFDFDSILHMTMETAPTERAAPEGHWRVQFVKGLFREISGRGDKAPLAEQVSTLRLLEPTDDVSPVELEGFDYKNTAVYHQIPMFQTAEWHKIRRYFQKAFGFDTNKGDIEKWNQDAKGGTYIAKLSHEANSDPDSPPRVRVTAFLADK